MRPLHEVLIEAASRQGVSGTSRRGVLALVAAAPAALGLNAALAQVDAEWGNDRNRHRNHHHNRNHNHNKNKNKGKHNGSDNGKKGDIAVLNYALTLEHLEFAFYRDALAQGGFVASDFDAFDTKDPDLFARLQDIRDHEGDHVDALIQLIQSLGGDPVAELCYDFGYSNAGQFIDVAQSLENVGVTAYDGAIADIKSGDLQTAGATIATVEARHASYLNFINGDNPFPSSFDTARSMQEVLDIASQFIVDCP
jgi:hypothetical protein